MRANRNSPNRDSWVELMEAKDGEKIEDVDIFKVYQTPPSSLTLSACGGFKLPVVVD